MVVNYRQQNYKYVVYYGNPPKAEQTRKEHVNMSLMIILQKGTNKNRNVFLISTKAKQ